LERPSMEHSMLRFFGVLTLVALLLGGWGYARGWFSVSKTQTDDTTRITFGLDKDKAKKDFQSTQSNFEDGLRNVDAKIDQLKLRAQSAVADRKVALDRQLADFDDERTEISKKFEEWKTAGHDRM